jgi:hypothetical protein
MRSRGQSLIETLVGIIFMIPIVLFLFDIAILVIANTAADNLAKQAARAASSAVGPAQGQQDPIGTASAAETAASTVVAGFQSSGFIPRAAFAYIYYDTNNFPGSPTVNHTVDTTLGTPPATAQADPGNGCVAIVVATKVQLPVPFPGLDTGRVFWARAVEPIVSLPAQ